MNQVCGVTQTRNIQIMEATYKTRQDNNKHDVTARVQGRSYSSCSVCLPKNQDG